MNPENFMKKIAIGRTPSMILKSFSTLLVVLENKHVYKAGGSLSFLLYKYKNSGFLPS